MVGQPGQEYVSMYCIIHLLFRPPSMSHKTRLCNIYAAAAVDTLTSYSWSMSSSMMKLNALPAILMKLNFFFLLVDIPLEKQASSSRMYSLNVAPHHQPIF